MNRDLHAGQILWRHIVWRTRESKVFFAGFMGACLVVPWVVAEGFIWASRRNEEKLNKELGQRPMGVSSDMSKVNKDRLQELLDDVKNKRDINDRYAAALRGQIMTGPPEARVLHKGGGTTLPPIPAPSPVQAASSKPQPATQTA
ncbi:hypothetical protein SELMODRAFT_75632 [Selaginella moellendorffii]|uniref:Uncharacterized protein n=1 Tax=Selaginella moellendorffii TaxID=88036 RepID=D8QN52_SELML|nr:uncharacterized protein LOC9632516 [Selaginella moellendorffii]EFJ31449.1 hypothetical protein SELMODRAFT_87599 [Selaginella moellendorffii]EFJ38697.1 hypothetical protein SELMODRAFT_75632 [Selaginella moellendorffii]|eukprot:XP_002961158.1 uncharacterized protein LOC9632516 [Selaginella moellendorffii]